MSDVGEGVSHGGEGGDVSIHRPAVKICGLTRVEDVRLAVSLGPWAVGMVLAPSPRRVTLEQARELAAVARATAQGGPWPAPLVVGVFAEVTAEEVASVAAAVGLDAVQLHGRQSPAIGVVRTALAKEWQERRAPGAPSGGLGAPSHRPPFSAPPLIIRALPVPVGEAQAGELAQAAAAVREQGADFILFDTLARTGAQAQFGGTGTAFAWQAVREAARSGAVLIAGGIGPGNVVEALRQSGAWGVDVSSGVEFAPGRKDHALMRALFERARAVPGFATREV